MSFPESQWYSTAYVTTKWGEIRWSGFYNEPVILYRGKPYVDLGVLIILWGSKAIDT